MVVLRLVAPTSVGERSQLAARRSRNSIRVCLNDRSVCLWAVLKLRGAVADVTCSAMSRSKLSVVEMFRRESLGIEYVSEAPGAAASGIGLTIAALPQHEVASLFSSARAAGRRPSAELQWKPTTGCHRGVGGEGEILAVLGGPEMYVVVNCAWPWGNEAYTMLTVRCRSSRIFTFLRITEERQAISLQTRRTSIRPPHPLSA